MKRRTKVLEMSNCILCNSPKTADVIDLRNGNWVHKLCVNNLESKISSIDNDIQILRTRLKEGFFLKIKTLLKGAYHSKELVNANIKQLEEGVAPLKRILQGLYDYYWERPPDWEERGYQIIIKYNWTCQHCGRRMERSVVPFHIHHLIHTAKPEGNHKLDNLTLLCEICHSKMPGHHLVKANRKKRLNRSKGRRRSQPSRNILGRYLSSE